MSNQKNYALIEDFDEKENTENTYLLQHSSETHSGIRGYWDRFVQALCHREESKNIADEHFGEELDVHVSKEKEEVVRHGIHTFALLIIAIIAIGVALIYLSFILVPLVLAWFFVYIFQPFINYLVGKKAVFGFRIRLPRYIAVIICALVVLIILFLLGLTIYLSILEIIKNSDKYLEHLNVLYNEILVWAEENGLEEQFADLLPEINIGELLLEVFASLEELVAQGILCLLFTMYMLLDYNEKKDKSDLERMIDGQIRKYIIIKTAISLSVGLITSFVLYLFSVDMWLLFGLLAFLLNFIPNVGAMVAAILPLPIAILDPNQNWITILCIFFIPVTIHFMIGNFVEPKVMGKSFEMSAVSVLVALAFWGAVWGIVGAFISVPITVVLHLWLRTVPHPMARMLAQLIVGEFKLFSVAEKLKSEKRDDDDDHEHNLKHV